MISSILEPYSRFSKMTAMGIRVPRNTHAPLSLPGTLSTAGHCDQSSVAAIPNSFLPLSSVEDRRASVTHFNPSASCKRFKRRAATSMRGSVAANRVVISVTALIGNSMRDPWLSPDNPYALSLLGVDETRHVRFEKARVAFTRAKGLRAVPGCCGSARSGR